MVMCCERKSKRHCGIFRRYLNFFSGKLIESWHQLVQCFKIIINWFFLKSRSVISCIKKPTEKNVSALYYGNVHLKDFIFCSKKYLMGEREYFSWNFSSFSLVYIFKMKPPPPPPGLKIVCRSFLLFAYIRKWRSWLDWKFLYFRKCQAKSRVAFNVANSVFFIELTISSTSWSLCQSIYFFV